MIPDKPEYERQTVTNYFYDYTYKIEEYGDLNLEKIEEWVKKVKTKFGKNIDINVYISDDGGFSPGPYYVEFTPYIERKETDEEYKKRIAKEEKEYNEYLSMKASSEYEKDMEEYKRIKTKYNL